MGEGSPIKPNRKRLTRSERERRRHARRYEAGLPEKTRNIRKKRAERIKSLGIQIKSSIVWMNHLCKVIFITPANRLVVWNANLERKQTIGDINHVRVLSSNSTNGWL